ncbi:hypothetical protein EXIGLDRAFT_838368 [Exidia glandulosa HHB12029]|uniref:F-box domain-containing protein n=1 Tax=Exidia glandulosa HHB12029 TaxID=1314781 RepID=A0A165FWU1_EXIGL|nr:hypothetical protein EXIGLDRAFT_838368 [Exidia glandulosa HHB12029]
MLRTPTTTCPELKRVLDRAFQRVFSDLDVCLDMPVPSSRHELLVDAIATLTRRFQSALDSVARAAARRANAHAPVNRLVDDVLVRIFHHVPLFERMRVSRTCQKWRLAARTDSSLWNTIYYDLRVDTQPLSSMLARTKGSLLDLEYRIVSDLEAMLDEDLNHLFRELTFRFHRLRSLKITSIVAIDRVLQLLPSKTLETLKLDWSEADSPLAIHIPIRASTYPSVTFLALDNVFLESKIYHAHDSDPGGITILRSFPSVRVLSFGYAYSGSTFTEPRLSFLRVMLETCPEVEELRLTTLDCEPYKADVEQPLARPNGNHPLRRLVLRGTGNIQTTLGRLLWYFSDLRPLDITVINETGAHESYRPHLYDEEISMFRALEDDATLSINGVVRSLDPDIFLCTIVGSDATGLRQILRTEMTILPLRRIVPAGVVTLTVDFTLWMRWPSGAPALPSLLELKLYSRHKTFLLWPRSSGSVVPKCDALRIVELSCGKQPYLPSVYQSEIERFVRNHVPSTCLPLSSMDIYGMEGVPKEGTTRFQHSAFAQNFGIHAELKWPFLNDGMDDLDG